MQRREEPTFHARRLLELVTFVRPNVESLLRQISRIGFASGQTQAKPVQIAVVKFHKVFKLQVGGSRRYPKMGVLSSAFVPGNAEKKQGVS